MAKKIKRRNYSSKQRNNYKDRDRLTDTGGLSKSDRVMEADSRDRRDCYRSAHNDPAWYAQNPQLLSDYASFPFGVPSGTILPQTLGYGSSTQRLAVPGVMALEFVPAIGTARMETDPINVAARNIYSFVRHANSGHTNYEAPDLMFYLMAMDSVYMFHSFMKRALGLVLDYSPTNRYYPRAVLQAMHVDPDDVAQHTADFRGFINQYAVKMGSMCVPNSMSYMARHTWMCEGLYTDDPSTSKAQTYLYTPVGFYQYQEATSATTAATVSLLSIGAYQNSQGMITLENLIKLGNDLLNPILASEDMNIMSGDILKAFGPEGVVKVSGVLDGYMVLPVYNAEVLSQFENAIILGGNVSQHIEQVRELNTGYITVTYGALKEVFGDYVGSGGPATVPGGSWGPVQNALMLNMHHDGVTPAEVMVASRLMFTYGNTENATTTNYHVAVTLGAVGSEIVTNGVMYTYAYLPTTNTGTLSASKFSSLMQYIDIASVKAPGTTAGGIAETLCRLSTFDWHPRVSVYVWGTEEDTQNVVITGVPHWDIANYTVLSNDNISNLHMAALLSEFSVPQMGAFSKSI